MADFVAGRVRKGKVKEEDHDRSGSARDETAEKGEKSKVQRPENKHDRDESGSSVTDKPSTTLDDDAEGGTEGTEATAETPKNMGKKKKRAVCQFHTGQVLNKVVRLSICSAYVLLQTEGAKNMKYEGRSLTYVFFYFFTLSSTLLAATSMYQIPVVWRSISTR